MTGGSDSHRTRSAPFVGYPRVYVQLPRARAHEPNKLLRALKRGHSFVTNGPLIALHARGLGPGDTLQLGRGERMLRVRIQVTAPAWMELIELELWVGERRAAHIALSPLAHGPALQQESVTRDVEVEPGRTLVATVRGRSNLEPLVGHTGVTAYAFTNPLWIAGP